MEENVRKIIKTVYQRFNERDIDGALALLRPDVEWDNGMEGGRLVGTNAVRDYWTRQWRMVAPQVLPKSISGEHGKYSVEVHQIVRSLAGDMISESSVIHVFTVEGGKIASMEIAKAKD
ncbi:nuclear transport factor 2 family protein [Limnoraphis robusta CCNP1324]|uniref:nuclear transport factor 2 family protein n=1 Tax=Limnoraphis robusta TaxID=1118279 RepID=UPI002B202392|nr:nuclear transport factor 2 family protein [Limnoraphis robusta]MEA5544546.1 nuclear transport factor 2 family protein [Limnoraphis robusta CCNP1324]